MMSSRRLIADQLATYHQLAADRSPTNRPYEMVCYQCRNAGHKKGDLECPFVIENGTEALDDGKEKDR